jgi:hypothetical protein
LIESHLGDKRNKDSRKLQDEVNPVLYKLVKIEKVLPITPSLALEGVF